MTEKKHADTCWHEQKEHKKKQIRSRKHLAFTLVLRREKLAKKRLNSYQNLVS